MGEHNPATAPARFWPKVAEQGDCWTWTAYRMPNGYGQFDRQYAHRWAYEHLRGEIPEGLELDHLCRVRHCVNPWHLEPVTHAENRRRARGVKYAPQDLGTHCNRGHERTPASTGVSRQGYRFCRLCARLNQRNSRAKRQNTPTQ